MSAIAHDTQQHDWDGPEQDAQITPGRPRRRFFNRKSAALAAVAACAAGFYGGVRVEKGQLGNTASAATASGASTAASAGGAAAGAGAGPRAGFLGGAARAGGANASFGTVSSVSANTIYLTDSSGNTVKVTLSSATKITKSQPVSNRSVRPGDTVVIQGLKNSNGTVTATSVSDNGAGATRTATSTSGNGGNATIATAGGTTG